MPEHGGRKADCEAPTMDPGPEPATVFVSGSDAGDSVLVGEAPAAATSVTVVMADGTSTDIAVDPQTKLFDWSGASVPKSIKAGGTSCSVGFGHGGPSAGSGLMCNSGVFDNTP